MISEINMLPFVTLHRKTLKMKLYKRLTYHTEQEVPVFGGSIKQYFQREFINFKQQI